MLTENILDTSQVADRMIGMICTHLVPIWIWSPPLGFYILKSFYSTKPENYEHLGWGDIDLKCCS